MSGQCGEYESVFNYFVSKQYPEGMSKDDKRRLREKCTSFAVDEGVLMHRGQKGKLCRVIIDPTEKDRIATKSECFIQLTHHVWPSCVLFGSGTRHSFP